MSWGVFCMCTYECVCWKNYVLWINCLFKSYFCIGWRGYVQKIYTPYPHFLSPSFVSMGCVHCLLDSCFSLQICTIYTPYILTIECHEFHNFSRDPHYKYAPSFISLDLYVSILTNMHAFLTTSLTIRNFENHNFCCHNY